jgi:hypothetical protein
MYNQTSTGRLATNLLHPGNTDPKQPSRQWVKGGGTLWLGFGHITAPDKDHFCIILEQPSDSKPGSGTPVAAGGKATSSTVTAT